MYYSIKKSGWLIGAILISFVTILQLYGTFRYYGRLPDNMIGIGIYSLSTILFAIVSLGFLINWRKKKES